MQDKSFLEILQSNSEKELEEFILTNGKLPKPICPIMFINKTEDQEIHDSEIE